jgi:hypothetical protein
MAQVHCGRDSKIKFPEIKHPAATARSRRHERLDVLLTENRADEVIGTDALGVSAATTAPRSRPAHTAHDKHSGVPYPRASAPTRRLANPET